MPVKGFSPTIEIILVLTWVTSVCSRGVIQDKNAGEIRIYSGQIFRVTIEIHRTVLKVEKKIYPK